MKAILMKKFLTDFDLLFNPMIFLSCQKIEPVQYFQRHEGIKQFLATGYGLQQL